jgi:hypothetical protein
MKSPLKLLLAGMVGLLLTACAAPGSTGIQQPSPQAKWYVYCATFKAAQPDILANIPHASKSTVHTVVPIADKVAQECQGPMPTTDTEAVQQLTTDVTTVLVQLGLQRMLPAAPTPATTK